MGMSKHLPMVLERLGTNLRVVDAKYERKHMHYGTRYGKSHSYTIKTDDPEQTAKNFFKLLTSGGGIYTRRTQNGTALIANMGDGSIITLRMKTSVAGSPAVDINVRKSYDYRENNLISHKIHFMKEGD